MVTGRSGYSAAGVAVVIAKAASRLAARIANVLQTGLSGTMSSQVLSAVFSGSLHLIVVSIG
jgi:hypothetical protein